MTRRSQMQILRRKRVEDEYPTVSAFCLFIGYPRSGHSVFGALLDAHPDMAIAFEADAIKWFEEGLSRPEIFKRLLENITRQVEKGRRNSGYSYAVPGQWQGRNRDLLVIGDKHGHHVSSQFAADPSVLDRLEDEVRVPLRLIHVVRNPFDVVARMSLKVKKEKKQGPLGWSRKYFARLARANGRLIASGRHQVLTVRHELFIRDPRAELVRACEFLGVATDDDYLDACASVVFDKPHHSRELIEWSDEEIAAVQATIDSSDFFAGYTFTSSD